MGVINEKFRLSYRQQMNRDAIMAEDIIIPGHLKIAKHLVQWLKAYCCNLKHPQLLPMLRRHDNSIVFVIGDIPINFIDGNLEYTRHQIQ